jgi:hypothetical protein
MSALRQDGAGLRVPRASSGSKCEASEDKSEKGCTTRGAGGQDADADATNLVASVATVANAIVDSGRMQTLPFKATVVTEKLSIAASCTKS